MFTPREGYEAGNVQTRPFGAMTRSGRGDPFIAGRDTAVAAAESDLYNIDLMNLKEVSPGLYDPMTSMFFGGEPLPILGDVHGFFETGWGIAPLAVNTSAVAVAAVANQSVTQNIVLTAGTIGYAYLGLRIKYPTAGAGSATPSEGNITAINRGTNTITVSSQTGQSLPAVTGGTTLLSQMGSIGTDGQVGIDGVTRKTYGQRWNRLGTIQQYKQWSLAEITKANNLGRIKTMFKDDIADMRKTMRYLMTSNLLNSKGGEMPRVNSLGQTEMGMNMSGWFPFCVENGMMYNTSVPVAGLRVQLEASMVASNFNGAGAERDIIGTTKVINAIADAYKEEKVRTKWSDKDVNLDIDSITRGNFKYNLIIAETLGEGGLFEAQWGNRVCLIDRSKMKVCAQVGTPMYREYSTNTVYDGDGAERKFKRYGAEANFTMEFPEPRQHAAFDLLF